MPLFRERREVQPPPPPEEIPPPPPPGPHLLYDGPVLAAWFVLYRLEQELQRARRYGAPLTILVAEPQLIVGERVSGQGRQAVAEGAAKASRTMDIVGWLDEQRVIIILPMTDAPSARFAAARLRDEMWLVSYSRGGQKWQISMVDDLDEIDALLSQSSTSNLEEAA